MRGCMQVSMCCCDVMLENEALFLCGAEQFSAYSGYGGSFMFAGDHRDATPRYLLVLDGTYR